jgi:anti-anti-sigma factor
VNEIGVDGVVTGIGDAPVHEPQSAMGGPSPPQRDGGTTAGQREGGRDMGTDLYIEVVRRGAEIEVAGRLDGRNAPVARAVLHSTIDEGHGDVLVRLAGLAIWDASGLGVVVGAHRRAQQAGRRLVLTDVPQRQLRLLRATRLHRVLTVEPHAVALTA